MGSLDDVQIFNRVFAPSEVPRLMNHPPSLLPVFDGSIRAGRTIVVTNAAADFDSPAQTLSYSLSSAPAGVTINSTDGVVTWRPAVAQAGSNYPIAVRVSDNGTPSMSATQSFALSVLSPAKPSVSEPMVDSVGFQMMIGGDSGPDYSVYVTTDLALNFSAWTWLLTTNPTTLPFQFIDRTATNYGRRFYRVLLGP